MIYRYKATLPKNKIFFRVYEIKTTTSLYALHHFLQNDLSFAPDQQVFFRTFNDKGEVLHDYGLFDFGHGAMDQVRLEILYKRGEQTLHYMFDVFNKRALVLSFDGTDELQIRKVYPRTIQEKGGNPDQFREEYSDFDLHVEEIDPIEEGIDEVTEE